MDDVALNLLTSILTIAGTAIAVNNYLNNRFSKLSKDMGILITEQAVDSTKLTDKIELLEYRINANTELIDHRTRRFELMLKEVSETSKERFESVKFVSNQSQEIILAKLNSQEKSVVDIQRFLAKKADFTIRD